MESDIVSPVSARHAIDGTGPQHDPTMAYAALVSMVDAVYCVDTAGCFTFANTAFEAMTGYALADLRGTPSTHRYVPEAEALFRERRRQVYSGAPVPPLVETVLLLKDGRRLPVEVSVSSLIMEGHVVGRVGVLRDITERKAAEAALRESEERLRIRAWQQQAVAQLGELALRERALQTVFTHAVATVAETLAVEYCKVLELLPEGDAMRLCAGVGWQAGLVGTATVSAGLYSQAGYTLLSDAPVVVEDLRQEQRFSGPPLLVEHGVISGMSYIIRGTDGTPWGVLGAHSTRRLTFTQDDVNFLAAVANILSDAIARERAEAALREREEHIRRLNTYLQADLARMTRLQEVSTRLVQTHDVAALLDEILDAALAITDADMGNIQLLDGDTLKIVAHRGFEAPFLDFFNTVHEGLAACGTALQRGERILVEDVTTSPLFVSSPAYDVMLAAQARAVQSTPLITRAGRMLGMFSTHYRTPHRPTPGEIHLLDILARQAADAIERAQAEAALRESEERFRVMADNLPLIVWLHDAAGRQEFVNHTFCEYFGVSRAEMRRWWRMLTHPADGTAYADEFLACVRERRPFHAEVRARRADGQWRWLESWGGRGSVRKASSWGTSAPAPTSPSASRRKKRSGSSVNGSR